MRSIIVFTTSSAEATWKRKARQIFIAQINKTQVMAGLTHLWPFNTRFAVNTWEKGHVWILFYSKGNMSCLSKVTRVLQLVLWTAVTFNSVCSNAFFGYNFYFFFIVIPQLFSPSPSSMSPGGRSKVGRQPGTLHGDRLTPRVPATWAQKVCTLCNSKEPVCISWISLWLTSLLQNLGDFENNLVQWASFFR